MATMNAVQTALAFMYCGDDQAVMVLPPTTDDTGLGFENWDVEARLYQGRFAQKAINAEADHVQSLSWNVTDEQYEGTILSAVTVALVPGQWTMDIWRTNSSFAKLLIRLDVTVIATIQNTP